ncbi:MAG TPA: OmpH family outer membrane protein [Allosphingosinicella sp.]|uniref:OmpH family outer membrane protein n=1 Tax=Allosphingosinicella sp. TaxID=2823234 RepID=UPI002EDB9A48
MKKIILGMALAAVSASIPTVASAQRLGGAVVAVVDTDRIYRECTACRAAQTQLQTQVTSLQQRAQQLGQPLQTEAQQIQTAINALNGKQPDAALTSRAQSLQQRQNTANQEIQRLEQNIRSTQAHVAQQIGARLNPIINQVMTQRGANLAVDVGATLAHSGALNVTNEVLAALNQQLPSVSVTPLPQQPAQQQPQGR